MARLTAAVATSRRGRWNRAGRHRRLHRHDVVLILKRGRHDVRGCQVAAGAARETDPKVFTKIHMHFVVTGRDLPRGGGRACRHMSHEKYCSASAMLAKTAEMTTSFEIVAA